MRALGYRKGQPFEVELVFIGKDASGEDAYLSEAAALDWHRMVAAAAAEGVELLINTAFRDHSWQQRLWDAWSKGLRHLKPCRPGWSKHEAGDAVDIDLVDNRGHARPAAAWLLEHAHEYNFIHPVAREPWHHEHAPEALRQRS